MMTNWYSNEANVLVPYNGCLKRRYPPLQQGVAYSDIDAISVRPAETGIIHRIALRYRYLTVSG